MLKTNFYNLINFLEDKKILILTHNLLDLDALASTVSFKYFLTIYFENLPSPEIYYSEINKSTKIFIEKVKEKYPNSELFTFMDPIDFSGIDVIVILDTNNLDQLKLETDLNLDSLEIPYIFIDHHLNLEKNYKNNISSLNIIEDKIPSTAEIIYDFYKIAQRDIVNPIRFLLLGGILTDSGFFKYASNQTFCRVNDLLNDDIKYQELRESLRSESNLSLKIAIIKGVQRVEMIRYNSWLIGVSHVSSFESSVASKLLRVGFDIGLVYSEKKDHNLISTRAKNKVCLQTDLHLGKVLNQTAKEIGGTGGGHDGAAAIKFDDDPKEVVKLIIEKLKTILKN
ncbi:MAG: putative manganese-dependent inorganic pyrophosphatase [Promethearchaeota archaeon]|nr:MAG: putative manganese-dependent inorganic pyrophosphatase [Candidatus Lokiarchaeota archaeon]